jgi:two-component system nitrate/nitrite response regulator NarL
MFELKFSQERQGPRVLVVSEVMLYREGVARGLAETGRFRIVGASESAAALQVMSAQPVDVVLLDAAEPSALEVARELKARWGTVPVVGFGISSDDGSLACAEAGVTGFVGRDGSILDLAKAIDRALAGEVLCSSRLAALLCARLASLSLVQPTGQSSPLTRREREIAELVANGLSNKEIALELRIESATVKNHMHSILEKLRVSRRSGIALRLQQIACYRAVRIPTGAMHD